MGPRILGHYGARIQQERLQVPLTADRLVLALDGERGDIVIRGWRRRLAVRPEQVMPGLEPYCSEFLCTCVHREGRMRGTDLTWYRKLRQVASLPVTAAAGIRSRLDVRKPSVMGMRAAVGMALYTGKLRQCRACSYRDTERGRDRAARPVGSGG